MARKPAPWFWKARRRWFVTIDGTRHDLGPDKKAAFDRFHQMMAEPRKRQVRSDSMLTLIDAFLDWCEKHRAPDTYEWYRYRLQRFAERYPTLTADQICPFHVQEWLDELADLASGSKRNHCRAVKRVMRWAMQQGYIDRNPIVLMEQPKAGRREVVLSQDEFDGLLDLVPDRAFRDLLVVTWETGCRPQESLRVEARHVDLTNSRWVFPESEAKGGMLRVVYLSERAAEITRRLMLRHPEGRLLCNTRGVPWTTDSVNCAFIRHQEKMGRAIMKEQGVDIDEKSVAEFAKTLCPERMSAGVLIVKKPGRSEAGSSP